MIAILKKPLKKIKKDSFDVEYELPVGYTFTVANPAFMSNWVKEEIGYYRMGKVESGEYFAFMHQVGVWFTVAREDCEIPISNGWLYNI